MNFSKMQERLLVRLYHLTLNGVEEGKFDLEFIENVTPDEIPRNLISKLLESLCEDKLLNRTSKSENWTKWTTAEFYDVAIRGLKYYSLTTRGLKYIDRILDEDVLEEWDLRDAYNADYLLVQKIAEKDETVPASDRSVTLKHNSQDYIEAVNALDNVIEEFEKDQSLDNELGHEKTALRKALEGGRALLEDTILNVSIGASLLLVPLKRIAVEYDQALVGALAGTAFAAIAKLLGL